MKTAVVIGSTGLIGSILIQKLVQEGAFNQVIAISRHGAAAGETQHPKVRNLSFDFKNWNDLELQLRSFIGTSPSCFFCCLGTTIKTAGSEEAFYKVDFSYVIEFCKLARFCKAERLLIVSALGADKNSTVFYNRVKGEMEEAAKSTFTGDLHFFRPSLLLGNRKDFRFSERVAILLAPAYSPILTGSLKKYRPVPAAKVAQMMAAVAGKKIMVGQTIENTDILNFN